MKEGIFISYRREGSSTFAAILYSELCKHFVSKNIFKDINTLKPGTNFKAEIEAALENSSVLLVLIDRNWSQLKNEKGIKRIFEENDFVRHEVKLAIEKNIEIIPVLFENGNMPSLKDLPKILRPLTGKQAFTIHAETVTEDIKALIEVVKSKKKFFFDGGTITGAYERLIKDPVGTIKTGWKDQSERYKKDFLNLKGLIKSYKKKD